MSKSVARRNFLIASSGLLVPTFCLGGLVPTNQESNNNKAEVERNNQPIKSELVHEFVKVAHGRLAAVKKLLKVEPRLIRATWDWGGGDFETALGAAAHTGQSEIATFLLEQGSPLDLFAAAMLGKLPIVKSTLVEFPTLLNVPGPHGIPLIAHARAGGAKAKTVVEYLEKRIKEQSADKLES